MHTTFSPPVPVHLCVPSPSLSPLTLPFFIISYFAYASRPFAHLSPYLFNIYPPSFHYPQSLNLYFTLLCPTFLLSSVHRCTGTEHLPHMSSTWFSPFAPSVLYQSPLSFFTLTSPPPFPSLGLSSSPPLTPLPSTWHFHSTSGSSSGLFARTGKRARKTRREITSLPSSMTNHLDPSDLRLVATQSSPSPCQSSSPTYLHPPQSFRPALTPNSNICSLHCIHVLSKTPLINRRSTNHKNAENPLVTIMIVRPSSLVSQLTVPGPLTLQQLLVPLHNASPGSSARPSCLMALT